MKRSKFPVVITYFLLIFFYLPIIILILNSFNASRFSSKWQGFSLKWYELLFKNSEIWQSFKLSLIIAFLAAIISIVLGTIAAFALHRYWQTKLQKIHFILIYLPLIMPEILMGISLLILFLALKIELGFLTVFLSHITFCISYVTMVIYSRLQEFDFNLIEAAQDLGASLTQTISKVIIPLLAPGIISGGLLAFTLSLDDFIITFFVAGPGTTTLPIRIFSMIKHGATPQVNALSTLLLCLTFVIVIFSQRFSGEEYKK